MRPTCQERSADIGAVVEEETEAGRGIDDFAREFERLFEESYGHQVDVDATFKRCSEARHFCSGTAAQVARKGVALSHDIR